MFGLGGSFASSIPGLGGLFGGSPGAGSGPSQGPGMASYDVLRGGAMDVGASGQVHGQLGSGYSQSGFNDPTGGQSRRGGIFGLGFGPI